jgi:AraC-like DNA-binding protein
MLSAFLSYLVQRNRRNTDTVMDQALLQIQRSGGNISISTLQEQLHISERSLERKFRQHIGLSPKLFSRICRFQASVHQLRNRQFCKLSDIAYEQSYSDQSHLIRAFKEFAGAPPQQFQRKSAGIVAGLSTNTSVQDPVLFYDLQRNAIPRLF